MTRSARSKAAPRRARASDGSGQFFGLDAGKAFVQSEGYKRIQNPATRGQRWTTGPVEVPHMTKGTRGRTRRVAH